MVGGNRDEYYSTRRLDKDVNLDMVLFTCIELVCSVVHPICLYTIYSGYNVQGTISANHQNLASSNTYM